MHDQGHSTHTAQSIFENGSLKQINDYTGVSSRILNIARVVAHVELEALLD